MNPDLFHNIKSYKTSEKEDAKFKEVVAPWRKFVFNNTLVIAVKGEKISKKELELLKISAGAGIGKYAVDAKSGTPAELSENSDPAKDPGEKAPDAN